MTSKHPPPTRDTKSGSGKNSGNGDGDGNSNSNGNDSYRSNGSVGEEGGDLVAVIMAGGAGTRFWPLSTQARPKQFLQLFGERSFLQQSYDRIVGSVPPEQILVMVHADYIELVRDQLPEIPTENIIAEPLRRDTAAAIALAALICEQRWCDPAMAVLTADHVIEPVEVFHANLRSILDALRSDGRFLYTFGIPPSYPSESYGYLERGAQVRDDDGIRHYDLVRFKEKPDRTTAEEYIASERYFWNSGMFVWRTRRLIAELETYLPAHLESLRLAMQHYHTPLWERALRQAFEPLARISIDYGVMEKTDNVRCIAATFEWTDIGNWLSLIPYLDTDTAANATNTHLEVYDATHNLVYTGPEEEEKDGVGPNEEVVALVGVSDLVVIRAGSRTLIVHRDRTEEIKQLVASLPATLR